MDAQKNDKRTAQREAVAVNRNLAIEVTMDEILDDLLFGVRA
jgi:hypothetical protein